MIPFDYFFDKNGLLTEMTIPGSDDGNGTHTAFMTGMFRFGKALKYKNFPDQVGRETAKFEQELDMLEVPGHKGWYRSHPEQTESWSNPNIFVAEATLCLMLAMGTLGLKQRLLGLTWAQIKRLGFYQNRTFIGITCVAQWIRALYAAGYKSAALGWPIVFLADLYFLISGLLMDAKFFNGLLYIIQARTSLSTPASWAIRKLLDTELIDKVFPIMCNIEHGCPPLYESLYKDVVKEYLT